jgi:hypothetical protein
MVWRDDKACTQDMCFVLVPVCSTGLYKVRSIVIAAWFHIWWIDTPTFCVENGVGPQVLVHQTRAKQVQLLGGDAYSSYLYNHTHLGLSLNLSRSDRSKQSNPDFVFFFFKCTRTPTRSVLVRSAPLAHATRTISTCNGYNYGYTCMHAHADTALLVGSRHTKPRLIFKCMLMAALNCVDHGFRHKFCTAVRVGTSS